MTKCNVIPQVTNSTSSVDSKLFKSINSSLGKSYKSVELRNRTKELYKKYDSKDFKSIFGDWKLYQRLKFETATEKDLSKFNTLYNGDIKLLEKSLNVSLLNDLYEPEFIGNINTNEAYEVFDRAYLDGKQIIHFKSQSELNSFISQFGDSKSVLNNILTTKNIYVLAENKYITNTTDNRVALTGNSSVVSNGSIFSLSESNKLFNEQTINTQDRNVSFLGDIYNTSDIIFISKLSSIIVLNSIEEFIKLTDKKATKGISTALQQKAIDRFIKGKIEIFKNRLLANLDKAIEDENNPLISDSLKKQRNDVEDTYNNLINYLFLSNPVTNQRPLTYHALISHLRSNFGIKINSESSVVSIEEEDDNGDVFEYELSQAHFGGKAAMKIDQKKNVMQEVKFTLAKSLAKSYVDSVVTSDSTSNKFGIQEPLEIDDVWNIFVSLSSSSMSREEMLVALESISNNQFNGLLNDFINELKTNDSIWNGFYASVNLPLIINKTLTLTQEPNGTTKLKTTDNNYKARASNIAYEQLISNIQIHIENNENYLNNIYEGSGVNSHNRNLKIETLIPNTLDKLTGNSRDKDFIYKNYMEFISARISALNLSSFMSFEDISQSIYIDNGIVGNVHSINFSRLDEDTKGRILKAYKEVVELLIRTTDGISKIQKIRSSKTEAQLKTFKFRDVFDQSNTVKQLAIYNKYKYLNQVNFSFTNVEGEMEHSGQKPFYVSDFFKKLQSVDKRLSDKVIIEHLSDFINSPALKYNQFLYNLDGDGTGIFNVVKDSYNENGTPVIDTRKPINDEFIKSFESGQFGGLKNTNNNKGIPYDELVEDTFNLTALAKAMQGIWITPSSDATRSYEIKMPKYGSKNFITDTNGNFVSLRKIVKELGLIDSKGNIKRRRLEDINEDSKFFFDKLMPSENVFSTGAIKSLKELRVIYEDSRAINKAKRQLVKALISNINSEFGFQTGNFEPFKNSQDYNKFVEIYEAGLRNPNIKPQYHKILNKDSINKVYEDVNDTLSDDIYLKALNDITSYFIEMPENADAVEYLRNPNFGNLKEDENTIIHLYSIMDALVMQNLNYVVEANVIKDSAKRYLDNPSLLLENDERLISTDSRNKGLYIKYLESKQYTAIKRTVLSEAFAMATVSSNMFNYDFRVVDTVNERGENVSKTRASGFKLRKGFQEECDAGRHHDVRDYMGRTKPTYDSEGIEIPGKAIVLTKDGEPTGRVFSFNRLTFSNGKRIFTMLDYAKRYIHSDATKKDLVVLVARMDKATHPFIVNNLSITDSVTYSKMSKEEKSRHYTETDLLADIREAKRTFDAIYNDFIEDYLENKQSTYIDKFKPVELEIKAMKSTVPVYVAGTSNITRKTEKEEAFLISTYKTEETLNERGSEDSKAKNDATSKFKDIEYRKSMLEVIINNIIQTANIGEDMLYGRTYEYDNTQDVNKRVSEIIRSGTTVNDSRTYSSATCEDISTASNMLDSMIKNSGLDKDYIMKNFADPIKVGDGFSFITVKEFEERAKATNHWNRLEPYVKSLTDPNTPLDPKAVKVIVEQLKYFMYSRQIETSGTMKGNVASYQEKNSTMVLFPKLWANTEYEAIINTMEDLGIDQFNFKSSSKLSVPLLRIHDVHLKQTVKGDKYPAQHTLRTKTDGVRTTLDFSSYGDKFDINNYIVQFKRSNLRIQQEQVSHIMETEGKLATQANKKIDVNLNPDATFTVNGISYKGKTGSHEDGKRGIFENRHSALHFNLKEDRDKLIYAWGAIKNGVIQKDMKGNILVDVSKIRDSIYTYYEGTNDISLMKAFSKVEGKVSNIISMNHPLIKNTIESILQAAITRNVNIKLPQIHGTIIPDTFARPMFSNFGKDDIIKQPNLDEYSKNGHISYTKEFLESWNGKPMSEWELRGEDYDSNGNVVPAQIILNVWDSRFDKYAKEEIVIINGVEHKVRKIDIDQIPPESRTVYFTRIPHEGMQSAGVAEVVGFMNTGASQIIVPKHLSKRTGWDYDIDSLYIYYRHLYEGKDKNGEDKLLPISYENDTQTKVNEVYNTEERKRLHVVKTYFTNEYNELIRSQELLISKARKDYKDSLDTHHKNAQETIYDLLEDILNDPDNPKYKDIINYIRTQLGDFTRDVESIITDFSNFGYEDYEKLYDEMFIELNELLDGTLDNSTTKEKLDKYLETHSITSSSTRNMLMSLANAEVDINNRESKEKLIETIEGIKKSYAAKIKELIESEAVSNVYKEMTPLQQMTRETRDNMIIDSLIAVTMSKHSTSFREKVNEFNTLKEVSDKINAKLGLDNKTLNFTDMFDRLQITSANKNIARLKGVAIQNQNTYSLLGVVGASVSEKFLIPTVMTQDNFLTDNTSEQEIILENKFGVGNYEKITNPDGTVKYIVYNTHLGNNKNGDWTNIHDRLITEQSSEVVANILDAVKSNLARNNGMHTQGVLDLFVNTPLSHVTDVYAKDKEPNSFVYVELLISQPVITKLINHLNTNSRNGKPADKNNAFRTVTNDLKIEIIKQLHSLDIISGKLKTDEKQVSILDLLIDKYNNTTNTEKEKAIATKLIEWKNAIVDGTTVYMNDTSGINGTEVYSELIKYLTKTNIFELVSDYIDNNVEISSEQRIKDKAALETSNLENIFKTLNISEQSNNSVYGKTKIGKTTKRIVLDSKSLLTIEELKNEFEQGIDKGYEDLNFKPSTIEEIIDYVNYIDGQLSLFKLYQQYDKTANLVSKASLVLRTDKLGTSPNSFVTLKLNDDMAALHIDYSEFDENLKLAGYNAKIRQELKFDYDSQISVADKIKVLENFIAKHKSNSENEETQLKSSNSAGDTIVHDKVELQIHKSGLLVRKENTNEDEQPTLLESVFPNFVRGTLEEDYKYEDSSLPLFESQYVNNYYFSIKALSGTLLSSNPEMVSLVKGIVSELGIAPNRYNTSGKNIYQRVLDSVIVDHIYNEVPFFNGGTEDQELRAAEVIRVIGNVMPVDESIKEDDTDILNSKIVLETDGLTLEKYRTLSVANQVFLLKSHISKFQTRYSINEIEDIKIVLNLFEPKLDLEHRQAYGYHKIDMTNTTLNIAKLQQIFRSMYFNDNPFVRQTARDLIRYSFYFYGLNWGMNVSKILDPSLMFEECEEYSQIQSNTSKSKSKGYKVKDIFIEEDSSERHRLYKVNEALYKLENQTLVELEKDARKVEIQRHVNRIKAQVYDDNTISPVVSIKERQNGWSILELTTGKVVKDSREQYVAYKPERYPVIVGNADFVNNSWEGRNKFFKTELKEFKANHKFTFEKYEPANSTKVYYYPINKSLPYESTQVDKGTVVKKYVQFVESEEYYKTLIDTYDAKYNKKETVERNVEYLYPISEHKVFNGDAQPAKPMEYKYITNITKSDKTLTETAKDIIESSTKVIYLGSDKFYMNAFKSDKTHYSDLDNLNATFFDSLDLQDTDIVAIVGDSLSDTKYTQKQIDNAVLPFVRNIMYYYEFASFKTIFKKGVGESVFKASFTSNKPNEYIEVGSRDTVRNVEHFGLDSNIMSGTHSSIEAYRQTVLDVFTYTRGIHDELVNKLDTKPNTFAFKHDEIIKYVSGLDTDNYLDNIDNIQNTILATLKHNVEILDMVFDYIENDTIKFRDTDGNVTMNTKALSLDIQKYMRGNNTNHKVLIAEKLSTYNKLLTIAENIMSIMAISEPDTTTEEFKALDDDTKNSILTFKKSLEIINLKIQTFKSDRTSAKIENNNRSRAAIYEGLSKQLRLKTQEYMVTNVNNYTRNRKFGDLTDYGKLLKVIEKNELSEVDFENLFKLNANEMAKVYTTLMKYNDDVSRGQMYLDSIRSTGISLIDNMLYMITEIRIQTNEEMSSKLNKLKQITLAYDKIKDKTFNYDKSNVRSSFLKDKFIDTSTGQFISKYNWNKFDKDLKVKERIASEYKEYSRIIKLDSDSYDNFTVYIKEVGKQLKALEDSNIKLNDDGTTRKLNWIIVDKVKAIVDNINAKINYINNPENEDSNKEKIQIALDIIKENLKENIVKTENGYNYYKFGKVNRTIITGQDSEGNPTTREETSEILIKIKADFTQPIDDNLTESKDIIIKRDKEVSLAEAKLNSQSAIVEREDKLVGNKNAIGYKEIIPNIIDVIKDGKESKEKNPEYNKLLREYLTKGLYANEKKLRDFERRNHIIVEDVALNKAHISDRIFTRESDAMHKHYKDTALLSENGVPNIRFYKIIPKDDTYINERYSKLDSSKVEGSLNDKEYLEAIQDYIKEIVDDVFPNLILPENFIPFIFMNSSINLKGSLKQLIGWRDIQQENRYYDYKGNPKHKFQSGYLIAPNINTLIKISNKKYTEAELEYQTRIVTEANEQLIKLKTRKIVTNDVPEFTSFMDVLDYNEFVQSEFIKSNSNNLNYDIPAVLHELTDELYNIKSYSEFSKVYDLLLETISSDTFEARSPNKAGRFSKNKIASELNDKTISTSLKGKDTRAYKHLESSADRLFKVSRTNNLFDQILGSAIKLTSMNTMWLNFHTGVKNVTKGASDIIIESIAGEYFNRKEYGWATNTYRGSIPKIIATLFTKDVTVLPDLVTAIFHRYGHIYSDHTDRNLNKQTKDSFNKFVNAAEVFSNFPTMTGEHYLQFVTLLAMMKSHRVVGNFVMSREEFLDTERYNIYAQELPKELKEELDKYIEEQKSNKNKDNYNKYLYVDHAKKWMTYNGSRLTVELTNKINKLVKEKEKEALKTFEGVVNPTTKKREGGFKTLYDHYSFKEPKKGEGGTIVVDEKITKIIETQFADRVKALNNSIHGVYNTIDRTKLQDTMFGEMVMQFRKWIMPTWYRWMGVKFSLNPLNTGKNQPFSEQLGHYRSGAFMDTFNFLKQPFISEYLNNKKAHIKYPALKALFGMLKGYADYFRKISFYYNQLTPHEQANVMRTAALFANILIITSLLFTMGALFGDDEEEDSVLKPKNSTILLLSGLQTEYLETLPIYGWKVFYGRTKQNVVPAERFLNNLGTLTYDLIAYPMRTEEQRKIKRGQYAGKDKVETDLFKTIPIARQVHKHIYIGSTINYFEMKNSSLSWNKLFFDEQLNNNK